MSGYSEFTLNDTSSVIREKTSRFKVEDGKTYRVSLAWWPDGTTDFENDAPRFIKAARYYKEGLGYVIHDNDHNQEYRDLLKDRPREVFATILVQWPTDDGSLDNNAFVAGRGFKVLPWIMSQEKISTLLRIHKSAGLGSVDLMITCPKGGGQYQKMEILPVSKSFKKISHGNLFRFVNESDKDSMESISDNIASQVAAIAGDIRGQIGRQYTIPEIKEKLGLTVIGEGSEDMGADDPDDILDSIIPPS